MCKQLEFLALTFQTWPNLASAFLFSLSLNHSTEIQPCCLVFSNWIIYSVISRVSFFSIFLPVGLSFSAILNIILQKPDSFICSSCYNSVTQTTLGPKRGERKRGRGGWKDPLTFSRQRQPLLLLILCPERQGSSELLLPVRPCWGSPPQIRVRTESRKVK